MVFNLNPNQTVGIQLSPRNLWFGLIDGRLRLQTADQRLFFNREM